MSLGALNSPPLVGAITAGAYGILPIVAKNTAFVKSATPFLAIKGLNALSYGLSMYSVSRPGRYDGAATVTEGTSATKTNVSNDVKEGMEQMGTSKGRTLLPPAPWAFIIWAPIFIGELLMVSIPIIAPTFTSPLVEQALGAISKPYLLAQVFQSLWAASFRPKYESGWYKYISAASLAGIAGSLSICHNVYSKQLDRSKHSTLEYYLYFLPLTLHFGWTTAASLVNLNGVFAMNSSKHEKPAASPRAVAWLGHASVLTATAIGVGITWSRTAPVYGGVICWALSAVASGLQQRVNASENEASNEGEEVVGIYGAKRQRNLSISGAAICAFTVVAVMAR